MQKYAVPFESRPPRLLQEKEAVEAGLLLCVDNKTRNQLVNQKFIFSVTAQRIDERNRKYSFVHTHNIYMYLRAIFCTFQISVDFYFVPVGGRGGGRG